MAESASLSNCQARRCLALQDPGISDWNVVNAWEDAGRNLQQFVQVDSMIAGKSSRLGAFSFHVKRRNQGSIADKNRRWYVRHSQLWIPR